MTDSRPKLIQRAAAVLGLLLPAACTDPDPARPPPTAVDPATETPATVPGMPSPAQQPLVTPIDQTPLDPSLDPCPPCGRG